MANKVVVKGLKLSDQGEWISKEPIKHGVINGRPMIYFDRLRYFTHLWLAKKFVPNPKDYKFVQIINPKKPLTAENVRWIKSPAKKIDEKQAKEIVKMWESGKHTMTSIAKKYKLSLSAVSRIANGHRWN